jgi:hypothetical protein
LVLVGVAGCANQQPQLPTQKPATNTPAEPTETDDTDVEEDMDAESDTDTDTETVTDTETLEEDLPDATATVAETVTVTATEETEPYPMPTFAPSSTPMVYPEPENPTPIPTFTPTPTDAEMTDEETGAITGELLDLEGKPVKGIKVFLAEIGEGDMISFNPSVSKSGFVNDEGFFHIKNIEPGQYSLAVWTPMSERLLPDPNRGGNSAILVTVIAGEVTDIGMIEVERPR